ncbi:hypothetical protein J6590_072289 [Homalodisca vitripennis]|nr:hypothetical protein J6590_072289 [Homalodisca vitripennis]
MRGDSRGAVLTTRTHTLSRSLTIFCPRFGLTRFVPEPVSGALSQERPNCVPCTENCDSEEDVFSYKPRYSAKSSESLYPETTPFISRISSRISSLASSEEELPKESTTRFDSALAEGKICPIRSKLHQRLPLKQLSFTLVGTPV